MKAPRLAASLLSLGIFSLTALAQEPRYVPVRDQSTRRDFDGFSLLPPQGSQWFLMAQTPRGVVFMKKIDSSTHSFSAAVLPVTMTLTWKTPAEFLEFVKKAKSDSTDPKRFKVITNEFTLSDKFGAYCVYYHSTAEDHGAVNLHGAKFLILDIHGYACLHPDSANLYFDIQYSERGSPTQIDPSLWKIGDQFLDGFRFTGLGHPQLQPLNQPPKPELPVAH